MMLIIRNLNLISIQSWTYLEISSFLHINSGPKANLGWYLQSMFVFFRFVNQDLPSFCYNF